MKEKSVLSTKKLSPSQRELLLNAGIGFVEYDAIKITLLEVELPKEEGNYIITSKNAVEAIFQKTLNKSTLNASHYFCVGEKTTAYCESLGLKVTKTAQNSLELANFIVKNYKNSSFYYFCGNIRRDELPEILRHQNIEVFEVKAYQTNLNLKNFGQKWDGILFFSPSGVQSYWEGQENRPIAQSTLDPVVTAFCIGETTATKARKYFGEVVVANTTSIESVIAKTVKTLNLKV